MKEVLDLKEGDCVLLTYRGNNYRTDVIGTSVLAIVENVKELPESPERDGEKSIMYLNIKVINDNASEESGRFRLGREVKIDVKKFDKNSSSYIELKIL